VTGDRRQLNRAFLAEHWDSRGVSRPPFLEIFVYGAPGFDIMKQEKYSN
jgi:hypothetical protein